MTEENRPDTLMVFCGKSLDTLVKEGGCGHWVVDQGRARRRRYLVAVRNHHAPWSEFDVPHGTAWLVATISDVVDSAEEEGRSLVKLARYAIIDKQMQWGSRNPVGYNRLENLGIDAATLEWRDFPRSEERSAASDADVGTRVTDDVPPLTFAQAKRGLALAMGIKAEQIEITIRV